MGLTTFRRYVRKRVRTVKPEDVTVRKAPGPPGEIAELDYGRLGMWEEPITGRKRVVQGFVMVLAFSRKVFVWPVMKCDPGGRRWSHHRRLRLRRYRRFRHFRRCLRMQHFR